MSAVGVTKSGVQTCSQSIMRWDTRSSFCGGAAGLCENDGLKPGGALLAALLGCHALRSCCRNAGRLGIHPTGQAEYAGHAPRKASSVAVLANIASQSNRRSRPWRGRRRRCSSSSSRACSAQPQATSSASMIASEMTLIALYDEGAHVAMLAHGVVPALLAAADGHLSRRAAHNRWAE